MNVLIIYRINTKDKRNLGVIKKMKGIRLSFEEKGHFVETIYIEDGRIKIEDQVLKSFSSFELTALSFYLVLANLNFDKYDLVYVRYSLSSPVFIRFLKGIRSKIVLEIPTYPYDLEFSSFSQKCRLWLDKRYRSKLKNCVDLIVHFGNQKEIFEISALPIKNGIQIDRLPLSSGAFNTREIKIVAVGKWNDWHGLDRFIDGMQNYDEVSNIVLHIIGDGPSLKKLRTKILTGPFNYKVIFHGVLEGESLNKVFENADIGLGSLGIHRFGLQTATPLKHREYVARGLPVVHAGNDPLLKPRISSISVPADNSPINIKYVIETYIGIVKGGMTKLKIRNIHKDELSWDRQVEKIISKLTLT